MDAFRCCPSHCCRIHGCKYAHSNCPVKTGHIVQEYLCEDCDYTLRDWEKKRKAFDSALDTYLQVRELRNELKYRDMLQSDKNG